MLNSQQIIIIVLISVAIFFILKGTIVCKNPKTRVEYRFIPRTLQEEMKDPIKLTDLYGKMFSEETV